MRPLLAAAITSLVLACIASVMVAIASRGDNPRRPIPAELAARQLHAEEAAARAHGFDAFVRRPLDVRGAQRSYSRSVPLSLAPDQCVAVVAVVEGFLDQPSILLRAAGRHPGSDPPTLASSTCGGVACALVWCAPTRRRVVAHVHAWHLDAQRNRTGMRERDDLSPHSSGGRITLSVARASRWKIGGLHAAHRGRLTREGIADLPEWELKEEPPPSPDP